MDFFNVAYADKDTAKQLGARWCPQARCWHAPTPAAADALLAAGFSRVAGDPTPIIEFPGEDRFFGEGLFVDLVPAGCWFTNVRYCVHEDDWQRMAKGIRMRAGFACEACGATGVQIEAHERWDYLEADSVQVLKRLVCLCRDCHLATHYGYARTQGLEEHVRAHLKAVNGWDELALGAHLFEAYVTWEERSARAWELELSIIEDAGIRPVRPVSRDQREAIASAHLPAPDDDVFGPWL